MEHGFKNTTLDVRWHLDGIHFDPLERLIYVAASGRTFSSIVGGFTSDGGSIPRPLWTLLPPTGKFLFGYVIHDAAFQDKLEELQSDGSWKGITLNEHDSNELLKECMQSLGGNIAEVEAVHVALEEFGWRAFSEDRKSEQQQNNTK